MSPEFLGEVETRFSDSLACDPLCERDTYTQEEWGKIERLVAERGKSYKTSKGARKHLKSL